MMPYRSIFVCAALVTQGLGDAHAQYVNSTAFCTSIRDHRCQGTIADGQVIDVGDLRRASGHPAIYFFASVNAPRLMPIVVNMVRQGACYSTNVTTSERKVANNPGMLKTFVSYVQSGRAMDDILRMLDITRAEGTVDVGVSKGGVGIDGKLNPVIVPGSNNYGVFDYRNVLCAGTILANITDSEGNSIPGDNAVKTLIVK